MSKPMFILPDGAVIGQENKEIEKCELEMLTICQKDGNFVIPLGMNYQGAAGPAFINLVRKEWFRLYDVNTGLAPGPNGQQVQVPCRYFMLTQAGRFRLNELKEKARIDNALKPEKPT